MQAPKRDNEIFPISSHSVERHQMSNSERAVLGEPLAVLLFPDSHLPGTAARGAFPVVSIMTQGRDRCMAPAWDALGCPAVGGLTHKAGGMHWDRAAASHPRGASAHRSLAAPRARTGREWMSPIKLTNSEP